MPVMRAVIYDALRTTPEVREVPAPEPPAGGVVVNVRATGLCHSDWHAWAGHDDVALPHIPGHELAGTVAAVGSGVRSWRLGDRVTVPFICGCGNCRWCQRGQPQVCPHQHQPGFTHWGSFAEQVALHAADANLIAIPTTVSDPAAASLGCRFATAYRGLLSRAHLRAGETVAVMGAGGVGLSAVMIARALGAYVIAVDRSVEALSWAAQLGAHHTICANGRDVSEQIMDITNGGAEVSVDAVGSAETCADAIYSLQRRGRHVQIGLLPAVTGHPQVPMSRVIDWELDVLGSHGMAAAAYSSMLELIRAGSLDPQRVVGPTIGLESAAQALPNMDQPGQAAGMTMINPALV